MPDADALQNPDINYQIFEHLSADEETLEQDIFGSNNSRWITVEEGHAGLNNEKVLFRTFVDAAIGGRGHTVHPKGAPYMITLSTTEGQSEPKVTIVNQSGSLGLTRDCKLS